MTKEQYLCIIFDKWCGEKGICLSELPEEFAYLLRTSFIEGYLKAEAQSY